MKKITKEEMNEYFEYKDLMGEKVGAEAGHKGGDKLSFDELDQVAAARGDQDFAAFLSEMEARKEREDK